MSSVVFEAEKVMRDVNDAAQVAYRQALEVVIKNSFKAPTVIETEEGSVEVPGGPGWALVESSFLMRLNSDRFRAVIEGEVDRALTALITKVVQSVGEDVATKYIDDIVEPEVVKRLPSAAFPQVAAQVDLLPFGAFTSYWLKKNRMRLVESVVERLAGVVVEKRIQTQLDRLTDPANPEGVALPVVDFTDNTISDPDVVSVSGDELPHQA